MLWAVGRTERAACVSADAIWRQAVVLRVPPDQAALL